MLRQHESVDVLVNSVECFLAGTVKKVSQLGRPIDRRECFSGLVVPQRFLIPGGVEKIKTVYQFRIICLALPKLVSFDKRAIIPCPPILGSDLKVEICVLDLFIEILSETAGLFLGHFMHLLTLAFADLVLPAILQNAEGDEQSDQAAKKPKC